MSNQPKKTKIRSPGVRVVPRRQQKKKDQVPNLPKKKRTKKKNFDSEGLKGKGFSSLNLSRIELPQAEIKELPITAAMSYSSLLGVALSYFSNGYVGGWASSLDPGFLFGAETPFVALVGFFQALGAMANAKNPVIDVVPVHFAYILQSIKPKTVPFHLGMVRYNWDPFSLLNPTTEILVGDYPFCAGYPDLSGPQTYASGMIMTLTSTLSEDDQKQAVASYTTWFSKRRNVLMQAVPTTQENQFSSDASAFARNYAYHGVGNTEEVSGWYTNCENEVFIRSPIFSKFAPYTDTQDRSSRSYRVGASDSTFLANYCNIKGTAPIHYKNVLAPVLKCINFDEIYSYLANWILYSITKAKLTQYVPITGLLQYDDNLDMTVQDFLIVLRQALMYFFADSQTGVQFTKPSLSSVGSYFQPFYAAANCYGNSKFAGMLMPTLLVENLCALKCRGFKPPTLNEKGKNVLQYFPVLGRYVLDTLFVPGYIKNDGAPTTIFSNAPQNAIDLTNGQDSTNDFINLNNAYYVDKLAVWNDFIGFHGQEMGSFMPLSGDRGPQGLSLITMTRYIATVAPQTQLLRKNEMGEFIQIGRALMATNKEKQRLEMEKGRLSKTSKSVSEKKIDNEIQTERSDLVKLKSNPPTNLRLLTTTIISSYMPISTSLADVLPYFILPVMRVDPFDSTDPFSIPQTQTESCETYRWQLSDATFEGVANGPSRLAQLNTVSTMCVPGIAGVIIPC